MKVEYAGVAMRIVEIHEYERVNVYSPDGADLLYVTHRVNLSAAMFPNGYPAGLAATTVPQRISDDMTGRAPGLVARPGGFVGGRVDPPVYDGPTTDTTLSPGTTPAFITDRIVHARLALPRQKLKISAFNTDGSEYVWLESPRPGATVDAANGPHVLVVNPEAPAGEGTSMVLNFQIETHLVPVDVQAERAVLSHRWTTQIDHDENYYPSRTIEGVAVFDSAVLASYNWTPDAFRNQLFHPIPVGYRRKLGPVNQSSDGLVLTYSFTDTLVECVFDPANTGATQINIVEDVTYTSPLF